MWRDSVFSTGRKPGSDWAGNVMQQHARYMSLGHLLIVAAAIFPLLAGCGPKTSTKGPARGEVAAEDSASVSNVSDVLLAKCTKILQYGDQLAQAKPDKVDAVHALVARRRPGGTGVGRASPERSERPPAAPDRAGTGLDRQHELGAGSGGGSEGQVSVYQTTSGHRVEANNGQRLRIRPDRFAGSEPIQTSTSETRLVAGRRHG